MLKSYSIGTQKQPATTELYGWAASIILGISNDWTFTDPRLDRKRKRDERTA
jgi:hypothetical protein